MKILFSGFIGVLLLIHSSLFAQGNLSNPFEQVWKINATQALFPDSTNASLSLRNPFDVVSHRVPAIQSIQAKTSTAPALKKIILRQQDTTKHPFVWWTLLCILGFLALIISTRKGVLKLAWDSFVSNNLLVLNQRDLGSHSKKIPLYLLYIHFLLNMGMFIFLFFRSLTGEAYNTPGYLLLATLGVSFFFIFKHVIFSIMGLVFPAKKELAKLDFLMLNFNSVLGLFLLPFNFILALLPGAERILPFWIVGIIVIFYIYRLLRAFLAGSKFIFQYLFHFLLYLCTVEFVPLVILLKMLLKRVA